MIYYSGLCTAEGCVVSLVVHRTRVPLLVPPWAECASRHVPWDWGGAGSSLTLALAILWDATARQRELTELWCPSFRAAVVDVLPRARFALVRRAVQDWIVQSCNDAIDNRESLSGWADPT